MSAPSPTPPPNPDADQTHQETWQPPFAVSLQSLLVQNLCADCTTPYPLHHPPRQAEARPAAQRRLEAASSPPPGPASTAAQIGELRVAVNLARSLGLDASRAEALLGSEEARREASSQLQRLSGVPPAAADLEAVRKAVASANAAGVDAAEVAAATAKLKQVEQRREETQHTVQGLSSRLRSEINAAELRESIDNARDAGVVYAALSEAASRLAEVEALERPLLLMLEEEALADSLCAKLVKHKVHSLDDLSNWQLGSLVRILGMTNASAAELHLTVRVICSTHILVLCDLLAATDLSALSPLTAGQDRNADCTRS